VKADKNPAVVEEKFRFALAVQIANVIDSQASAKFRNSSKIRQCHIIWKIYFSRKSSILCFFSRKFSNCYRFRENQQTTSVFVSTLHKPRAALERPETHTKRQATWHVCLP
jgi:hypothetical protein